MIVESDTNVKMILHQPISWEATALYGQGGWQRPKSHPTKTPIKHMEHAYTTHTPIKKTFETATVNSPLNKEMKSVFSVYLVYAPHT